MRQRFEVALFLGCVLLGGPAFAADPSSATPANAAAVGAPLMTQEELLAHLDRKDPQVVVLDVRTPEEFAAGHVPGARNVSHDQLAANLDQLASLKDKQVVLYCRTGRRTALATETLKSAGFQNLRHLEGDYQAWAAANRPVEK
jgi:phage shock protein E